MTDDKEMQDSFSLVGPNGTILGSLTLPNDEPAALAICLHGGPGGDRTGNELGFNQIAASLEARSVATLQFDFCGSGVSDGKPSEASIASQVRDYEAVLDYVIANFSCPIHVIGESAGATIASSCWRSEPTSYLLLWPAFDLAWTDLKVYLDAKWQNMVDEKGYMQDGGLIIGADLFTELKNKDFSSNFDLPHKDIFLAHGQKDQEVPYEQSLKALATAKKTLVFLSRDSAGHGFKDPKDRQILLKYVEHWICDRTAT